MRYVGTTSNIEKRMAQQFGVTEGAAQWCKVHKPVTVLEVRLCNNAEEAQIMENCLTSVHQAAVGYQACRGSRCNMSGQMKRPPPHFGSAPEYVSPRSEDSTPELPSELPPMYEKLKTENGIEEATAPKPCLEFVNHRDPDKRWGHLAAILP